MKHRLLLPVLMVVWLIVPSPGMLWGQVTNPPPITLPAAPAAPAPAAPARPQAPPSTPAPAAPASPHTPAAPAPAAPQAPPPSAPAPAAPAANEDPEVMLLKQGHTDTIRAKAAHDLGAEGNVSAIPALAAALGDTSPKVRREVVVALGQFHLPSVLPPLEKAASDLDEDVRFTAVQCLVGYYSGAKPDVGFTGFMKKNWQRATSHFQPDDTRIDPGVAVDPTVIATLVTTMKDIRSNAAALEAAKGLGILLARSAAPDLVMAAHSSDGDLARQALNALAKLKVLDTGPKLVDLLDSPNKDVKRDACVDVGILRAKEALPKLQTIFQTDPDEKDKVAAMQGLAYLGDKVTVPLFTKALWDDNKDIRIGAGEGLARAGDFSATSELTRALSTEKDEGARLAMEFALSALGNDNDLSDVVSELSSKIRGDVARSYLVELSRNPVFLGKLYPYLQSPDTTVRRRLCEVLMYSGDQSSMAQLDRLQHDPDSGVAAAALRAKRAIRARLDAGGGAAKS